MHNMTLDEMYNVGLHYGHKKEHSTPMVKPYVYTVKDGICIFDLSQTKAGLESACEFLTGSVAKGQVVLLVGTKKQAKSLVAALAQKLTIPHISTRWLGGLLTNFTTVRKSLDQLQKLEQQIASPEFAAMKKGEQKHITDAAAKLHRSFDGIKDLARVPDVMVVVDGNHEANALEEAKRLGVGVVATIDSDGDPTIVDYAIPCNDDAPRGLRYVLTRIGEAIAEGKGIKFDAGNELAVDTSSPIVVKKTGAGDES